MLSTINWPAKLVFCFICIVQACASALVWATNGDVFEKGVGYNVQTYTSGFKKKCGGKEDYPNHPSWSDYSNHYEQVVDINSGTESRDDEGMSLYAPEDGSVTIRRTNTNLGGGWGNAIEWQNSDASEILFLAHLESYIDQSTAKEGDKIDVKAGDEIGKLGGTGKLGETGKKDGYPPHLHIESSNGWLELSGEEIHPPIDVCHGNGDLKESDGPDYAVSIFEFWRHKAPIFASNKNQKNNFDTQFKIRNDSSSLLPLSIDDMAITIFKNGSKIIDCWTESSTTPIVAEIPSNGTHSTGIQYCEIYDAGDYTVEARLKINGGKWSTYETLSFTVLPPQGMRSYDNELAIVLDRSGSMSEASKENGKIKMEKAKEAIASVVPVDDSKLGVSLSVFSDSAETIQEMTSVESFQASMQQTLELIQPGGGTNIGSGLSLAYQELDKTSSTAGGPKVVELLSDGHENQGNREGERERESIVQQFKIKDWPIYTIPFGLDADHETLKDIAWQTGAIFDEADTNNLTSVFQRHLNHSQKLTDLIIVSDNLPPDGQATYPFSVGPDSQNLKVQTSWLGSQLRAQVITPGGSQYTDADIEQLGGRYFEGDTFQSITIPNPAPGNWSLQVDWSEPPEDAEQININITGKTDLAASIFGLKPSYQLNDTVNILIDIDDVSSGKRVLINDASIVAEVQKPEEKIIRLLHAKTSRWEVYREVERDITRTIEMFDDGQHGDFDANDGIYGGYFQETNLNGPYAVSLDISGVMQNGADFSRQIHASFQVGDIKNNLISNSHWLKAKHGTRNETTDLLNDAVFSEPLDTLDKLMDGQSGVLDSLLQ